jgi:hypothetical protein
MPIEIKPKETEDEFVSRCMSEEAESFPDESQRYAVCKSTWDNTKMTAQQLFVKQLKEYIKYNSR